MVATTQGRAAALLALKIRRQTNLKLKKVNNASLPAGSPMYYNCIACGEQITMPEGWVWKPDMCDECEAMHKLGWLE